MGSQANSAPPRLAARLGGEGGWAELVCGLRRTEATGLGRALVSSDIAHRQLASRHRTTVMVLRLHLDEARFVLAAWAFGQPSARKRPRRMNLFKHLKKPIVMLWIAALMAAGASSMIAPHRSGAETACSAKANTYLISSRVGCGRIEPARDRP